MNQSEQIASYNCGTMKKNYVVPISSLKLKLLIQIPHSNYEKNICRLIFTKTDITK